MCGFRNRSLNTLDGLFSDEQRVDVLMNNAAILAVPQGKTVDGFETQFATNVLGKTYFLNHYFLKKPNVPQNVQA